MRLQLVDLSQPEHDAMHGAILRLLGERGVLFEDSNAREMLAGAGNRIDTEGRMHLAPRFVESMLAMVPRDGFTLYGRDPGKSLRVAVDEMSFRPSTGAPFVLDFDTRRRRPATIADTRALVTLTDALDGYAMVNEVVTPAGDPGGIGTVRSFIEVHRHSLKPSDQTVMGAREVEAIGRIASLIRGGDRELREKPLTAIDVALIPPLRCTQEQTGALLACARRGIPIEVLTSPQLAVSSPVTLAGGAAIALAECIAALCLVYLVSPGLGIIATARVQPTNLRSMTINYGSPELGMASVLVGACCARYGIPSNLYGFGTSAPAPGGQAEMEKTASGLLMALGRAHMITGSGMLDNGLTTCPEQLVIDDEAIRFIRRIRRPMIVDEAAIGIDAFLQGIADTGTMLGELHTLEHLRHGEAVSTTLGQWDPREREEGITDLWERAHSRVGEILASHRVEPYEASLERRIAAVLDEASIQF